MLALVMANDEQAIIALKRRRMPRLQAIVVMVNVTASFELEQWYHVVNRSSSYQASIEI